VPKTLAGGKHRLTEEQSRQRPPEFSLKLADRYRQSFGVILVVQRSLELILRPHAWLQRQISANASIWVGAEGPT
jgi:hypothetical protein